MRRLLLLFLTLWAVPLLAQDSTITSISPPSITSGYGNFTLTVHGNLVGGCGNIYLNNTALTTIFTGSSTAYASVTASLIHTIGTAYIQYVCSTHTSSKVPFSILTPLASVYSFSPTWFVTGQDTNITVNGNGFASNATIIFDWQPVVTTFVNSNTLTGTVTGNLILTTGNHKVDVYNGPFPGGSVTYVSPPGFNAGTLAISLTSASIFPSGIVVRDTSGTVILGSPWFTITGPDLTSFTMSTITCSNNLVLPPSTPCSFTVLFTPVSAGTKNATLNIFSNALNAPQSVSLTGTAVTTKTISASPSSLSFSSTAVGATASALTFNVFASVGSFLLSTPYYNHTLGGTNPGDFAVTGASTCTDGGTLPCNVAVSFTPGAAGNRSATLTIQSAADNSSLVVSLSGVGVTVSSHHVLLNWGASSSSNIVGYNVYRATPGNAFGSPLNGGTPVNALTYTDTTSVAGTTYVYGITAVGGPPAWPSNTESTVAQSGQVTP